MLFSRASVYVHAQKEAPYNIYVNNMGQKFTNVYEMNCRVKFISSIKNVSKGGYTIDFISKLIVKIFNFSLYCINGLNRKHHQIVVQAFKVFHLAAQQ